jgi:hypothetical protein
MGLMTKEMLLTKQPLTIEKVDLGNGDFVYVREMNGYERDHFEASLFIKEKDAKGKERLVRTMENLRSKMVISTMCDENGNLILSHSDMDTFSTTVRASILDKIASKAQELNGITEEDAEKMVKNSNAAQSEGKESGSGAVLTAVATEVPISGSEV